MTPVQVNRSVLGRLLRQIADELDSDGISALSVNLDPNGLARVAVLMVEGHAPVIPEFIHDAVPTAPDSPAAKRREDEPEEPKESPEQDIFLDADHLRKRP